jgi:hypothetical protein
MFINVTGQVAVLSSHVKSWKTWTRICF